MATTLRNVNELFEETIEDITQDSNNWQLFLKCASMNYKYNFSDQLLIYAQISVVLTSFWAKTPIAPGCWGRISSTKRYNAPI